MADVTFVALSFGIGNDGPEPREAAECTSASAECNSSENSPMTTVDCAFALMPMPMPTPPVFSMRGET